MGAGCSTSTTATTMLNRDALSVPTMVIVPFSSSPSSFSPYMAVQEAVSKYMDRKEPEEPNPVILWIVAHGIDGDLQTFAHVKNALTDLKVQKHYLLVTDLRAYSPPLLSGPYLWLFSHTPVGSTLARTLGAYIRMKPFQIRNGSNMSGDIFPRIVVVALHLPPDDYPFTTFQVLLPYSSTTTTATVHPPPPPPAPIVPLVPY